MARREASALDTNDDRLSRAHTKGFGKLQVLKDIALVQGVGAISAGWLRFVRAEAADGFCGLRLVHHAHVLDLLEEHAVRSNAYRRDHEFLHDSFLNSQVMLKTSPSNSVLTLCPEL